MENMNHERLHKIFMRTKRSAVVILSLFFVAAVIWLCIPVKYATADVTDCYTVCEEDGYYSETTYFLTEEAYTDIGNASADSSDGEEFVSATRKRVWVCEFYSEADETTESQLLSKSEVDEIESEADGVAAAASTLVGSDSESFYYLDIDMAVYYNTGSETYSVTGDASWQKVWTWNSMKAAEEDICDYIGITWGGAGTLCATSKSISGYYYNSKAVSFSRKISDSYAGYVWQFNEKSGYLGKELESATANVTLEKDGELLGKTTNVKMTYIHTYSDFSGSVSLSADSDGTAAASVSLSQSTDSWQIEIDVAGISY